MSRTLSHWIELCFTFSLERSQTWLMVSTARKAGAQVHCSTWVTESLKDPKCGNVLETPDRGPEGRAGLPVFHCTLDTKKVWSSQNCSRPGFLDSKSTGTRVLFGSGVTPKAFC